METGIIKDSKSFGFGFHFAITALLQIGTTIDGAKLGQYLEDIIEGNVTEFDSPFDSLGDADRFTKAFNQAKRKILDDEYKLAAQYAAEHMRRATQG